MTVAPQTCDFAVIGAGIVGLATARELTRRHPGASIALFDRESRIAAHQTGHSSGVIHSGVYYRPESLKARLCVEGARRLYDYCAERRVPVRRDGKLIVATDERELPRLDELERRGRANGVPDLVRLGPGEIREHEPACTGIAALQSPAAGVVSFAALAEAIARELRERGIELMLGCEVHSIGEQRGGARLEHTAGRTAAGAVVACAGAWSERLAVAAGADREPVVVSFRGAFTEVTGSSARLVRASIYPVPDPELPFLGVHMTRAIDGRVIAGPNALPAAAPDSHERHRIEISTVARAATYPGTLRMAWRNRRSAAAELSQAISRRRFAEALRRLVPGIDPADLRPAGGGVRAQAIARDGALVDDFIVSRTGRTVHVRNAPSPAATACLALAELIADEAEALS